ncbi:hypothetical protein SESBI_06058 [Sesbania bispinosa]|nr:hypothetical protein SESBI_06058 [Sesbania bispinosa]
MRLRMRCVGGFERAGGCEKRATNRERLRLRMRCAGGCEKQRADAAAPEVANRERLLAAVPRTENACGSEKVKLRK